MKTNLFRRQKFFSLFILYPSLPIINEFNIPTNSLPIIKPSLHNYGECKSILEGIPITAGLGDQQASLFGQHCFKKGEVKTETKRYLKSVNILLVVVALVGSILVLFL